MLEPNDWQVTSAQLCELFGVPHKTLSRWHTQGMPKLGRGVWDLRLCLQWLIQFLSEGAPPEDEAALALSGARISLTETQQRKLAIEVDRLEGKIYDADVVHQAFDRLAVIVVSAHGALPGRAAELVGKPVEAIEELLESECRSIGEAIAHAVATFRVSRGQELEAMEAAADEA